MSNAWIKKRINFIGMQIFIQVMKSDIVNIFRYIFLDSEFSRL